MAGTRLYRLSGRTDEQEILDDDQAGAPVLPQAAEPSPEDPVAPPQPGALHPSPKDGKLLAESKILRRQPGPITEYGAEQNTKGGQKAHRRLRSKAEILVQ